jgi:diacylglycerol kinase (ATP)
MRVHLIGNRTSPETRAWLHQAGHAVIELAAASVAESITTIRSAIESDDADRIVVIGGDGMVHAAVNAIAPMGPAASHVVLGIVALGSGNDFARALGLPVDAPTEAAKRAISAATPIDLLKTTHGWVASVATCGFPARVNKRANKMRWPKGSSKYTVATLTLVPTLVSDRLSIAVDDQPPEEVDLTILAVGNTAWFGGGMNICPGALPTDGTAELVQVDATGRLELLRYLPAVFTGEHIHHRRTHRTIVTHVKIDSAHTVELWGDGEMLGQLPVEITVVPNAVRIAGFSPQ